MASTFKFHSQVNEVVPWQAQYAFPVQATRVQKQVVKLPPKNGSTFASGNIIRIEFPADNYLNVLNSVLQFDLGFTTAGTNTCFQRGGAHNLISRLRILYGSLVIEDIQNYSTLVRIFTELGVQGDYMRSSGSILDGMETAQIREVEPKQSGIAPGQFFDTVPFTDGTAATTDTSAVKLTNFNTSVAAIRKFVSTADSAAIDILAAATAGAGTSPATKRTFCLNLMSGLLTAKKLLPLKWMAAQLAIEITLNTEAASMLYTGGPPVYQISNVNFIAEMLEFDSTYDQAFYMGLQSGGVPIKFSSWHFHSFNLSGSTTLVQIHERARSLKAAFAVVRSAYTPTTAQGGLMDTDRFYHDVNGAITVATGIVDASGAAGAPGDGKITQFQWRVGGRYYPAQPVNADNGGAEAFVELMKTLNVLGDYTVASNIDYNNFTSYGTDGANGEGSKFIMSCEFENTDVQPGTIAGINAEEQSDIALSITAGRAPSADDGTYTYAKRLDVFMHYDSLIVVKDGNTVDLIL